MRELFSAIQASLSAEDCRFILEEVLFRVERGGLAMTKEARALLEGLLRRTGLDPERIRSEWPKP